MRETSTDAFQERIRTGAAKSDKLRVLDMLRRNPMGLAGFEVDGLRQSRAGRGHHHKRLPELGQLGLAHREGTRKNPATGRRADVWFAGPAPESTVEELAEQMHAKLKEACALDARAADLRRQAERYRVEIKARAPQRELFR